MSINNLYFNTRSSPQSVLFCKIQKHKAFLIISCSLIFWSCSFSFDHVISFLYICRAFKASFKNYFSFLTNALLEVIWIQKILGAEDFHLNTDINEIWFNSKHWKTNLKAILEAPTKFLIFNVPFLWRSCPSVNAYGRKAPPGPTWKTSEHCCWVSPPAPWGNRIRRRAGISLEVRERKEDPKRAAALMVPKFMTSLCEQYWVWFACMFLNDLKLN